MSNFKIEKSVPMPTKKGREATNTYPFADMEIGDSFALQFRDKAKNESDDAYAKYCKNEGIKLSTSANQWVKRHSKESTHRFSVRTQANGVRIWRVEVPANLSAKSA